MAFDKIRKEYEMHLRSNARNSERTIEAYIADLSHFMQFLDDNSIKNIEGFKTLSKRDILDYMQRFHKLSASTYNRRLSSLKSFYNFLIDYDYIDTEHNCVSGIVSAKQERKIPRALSSEQVQELLKVASKPIISRLKNGKRVYETSKNRDSLSCTERRNRAVIFILFSCGLRASEASTLLLKNIIGEYIIIKGKGNKERKVPLPTPAKKAIERWLSCRSIDSKYVFTMENQDKNISTNTINRIVKKYVNVIGIDQDEISSHIGRKSYATALHKKGVDIRTIQELLGHSDISTTQMYVSVDLLSKDEAVLNLDFFENQ